MSDVMLHGVLRMPPELWRDDPLDVSQRHSRYIEASERIEADAREIERLSALYYELLFAVCKKYPGETRHQTALRYIRQAEASVPGPAQQSEVKR